MYMYPTRASNFTQIIVNQQEDLTDILRNTIMKVVNGDCITRMKEMSCMSVYTTVIGNNDELIKRVAELYLNSGDVVADVTYGRGVWWKKVDLEQYDFYPSDIITCPDTPYDFKDLPHEDESLNVVAFDPPYMHTVGRPMVDPNYLNSATTHGMCHQDIMQLYHDGMKEARRVLVEDGFLWVKCQDEIESGHQRWSHIDIYNIATQLGFYGKDLFILVQTKNPHIQRRQLHARKKHSYLWIFQKIPTIKFDRLTTRGIVNTRVEVDEC